MSSLWTPEGEHRVGPSGGAGAPRGAGGAPPAGGAGAGGTSPHDAGEPHADHGHGELDEEAAARLAELRGQLVATPVEVVVANHAYGLFELAAIHLSEQPAQLDQARLAIDAFGLLVEGLAGRLGEAQASLTDALAQLRLAFVQVQAAQTGEPGPATAAE